MRGSLSEFTVGDLLQLYQIAGKSGTLRVSDGERTHTLYFDRGQVNGVGAERWSLIAELLRVESLTADARRQLERIGEDGGFAGIGPIARALVTSPVWDRFVELQIERLVYPPLVWQRGEFTAEVEATPLVPPLMVKQAPQQVILNAARWEEEVHRAKRDGFGVDSRWRRVTNGAEHGQDEPLLPLVAASRTLDDLAALTGMSVLLVIDRLRHFAAHGLIEPAIGALGRTPAAN